MVFFVCIVSIFSFFSLSFFFFLILIFKLCAYLLASTCLSGPLVLTSQPSPPKFVAGCSERLELDGGPDAIGRAYR